MFKLLCLDSVEIIGVFQVVARALTHIQSISQLVQYGPERMRKEGVCIQPVCLEVQIDWIAALIWTHI